MADQDQNPPPEPARKVHIDGSVMGVSSSESGGNYDSAGPTAANIEGEPVVEDHDGDPTTGREEEQR
jgi:hypothetical protein